jgi:hypothetical protein
MAIAMLAAILSDASLTDRNRDGHIVGLYLLAYGLAACHDKARRVPHQLRRSHVYVEDHEYGRVAVRRGALSSATGAEKV